MSDPLGDRMKSYEDIWRQKLPRRAYTLIRLDGRAFHGLTRDMERPFDQAFAHTMDLTAERLCESISGVVLAYTQSDEISILMQDFESTNTQPWFDGNIQKIVSISAGMASVHFHAVLDKPVLMENTFDARVFSLSDPVEVANYFIWRQRDAVRNSIQMAGQSKFSQSALHRKSTADIQEMLFQEHKINWNDYPDGFKRGRVCWKVRYDLDVPEHGTTERYRWTTVPAPHFVAEPGTFLASLIPPMPTLPALKES